MKCFCKGKHWDFNYIKYIEDTKERKFLNIFVGGIEMFSAIIMLLGASILMIISVKLFVKQMNLINKGVKKKAKVIELQSFSYITYGSERNKIYNVDINPVLEIDLGNEKLRIDYHDYDEMSDLNEGDEVELIYPEGNIKNITRYSKYELLKKSIWFGIISFIIMIISISLIVI